MARARWRSIGPRLAWVPVLATRDWSFKALAGYGHAPGRVLYWALGIVALAALLYGHLYTLGQMAPNSDIILTSADWKDVLHRGCATIQTATCTMPLRLWEQSPTHVDYETFSALAYAFDLFIPLDALGQENAWTASKDRGWWGAVGYYARWAIQVSGWILTAVGAATVTGVIGRRD